MTSKCKECQAIVKTSQCELCDGETEQLGPFYVNTYLVDRAYGGPQEGGWWYSYGEPIDSRLCADKVEADKIKQEMENWCKENNKGRRPIYSVLSTGEYQIFIEDHFATEWPDRKPQYE